MFRPIEADIDLSRLQFSDYPNQGLQVADYSNIEYLKQSDSEEEMDDDVMNYTHGDSESLIFNFLSQSSQSTFLASAYS